MQSLSLLFFLGMTLMSKIQWTEDADNLISDCGSYVITPCSWYPSGQPERYMVEYFYEGVGFKLPGVCWSKAAAMRSAKEHRAK